MSQSFQAALTHAGQRLSGAGIEEFRREARILLAFVVGLDPLQVSMRLEEVLNAEQSAKLEAALRSRVARVPMSHILGYRDFYEHRFIVTPDVLDPRPETEELVARALSAPFENVLDLGTGSGCIILSLLAENSSARGLAVDQSAQALEVARRNAENLRLTDRLRFCRSDWCQELPAEQFDLIVSNPPYIHPAALKGLSPEVHHEPISALTDNIDGLSHYATIAHQAHGFLAPQGRLLFEIGYDQGAAVAEILRKEGYGDITILEDLDHRPRVVSCRARAEKME
ncbi:peptide chain release factor N(5)-glutamine methyltransferase [uncultured Planktomarina sp.]|jgi:release factor glutamine methyltransferase|uniref:peptide chain release factor N(5)-glutamine methyltransferase n=1 Tax=uncultured Planktomarina sp. TaxID=1538529 RepID=UPI0032615C8F